MVVVCSVPVVRVCVSLEPQRQNGGLGRAGALESFRQLKAVGQWRQNGNPLGRGIFAADVAGGTDPVCAPPLV